MKIMKRNFFTFNYDVYILPKFYQNVYKQKVNICQPMVKYRLNGHIN